MHFGVTMFPADYAMNVVDLGRAVEERGFESLFLPEHTHIPVKRETPWPGAAEKVAGADTVIGGPGPSLSGEVRPTATMSQERPVGRTSSGGELPPEYARTLDPFVALAMVAAVTTRLKLGTGICLVIQRDPFLLAKEVATLDQLSRGRFLFGVGAGWLREEVANHGVDPRTRWRVFDERMRAIQTLWSADEAEFHGRYVNFDPVWAWPKPFQKPRPPVLMGGDYAAAIDRVVEYGDDWMPHPDRGEQPLKARIAEFWQRTEAAGRGRLPVTVYGARADERFLEEYRDAGVSRCVFRLPPAPADEVLPVLDRAAKLAAAA